MWALLWGVAPFLLLVALAASDLVTQPERVPLRWLAPAAMSGVFFVAPLVLWSDTPHGLPPSHPRWPGPFSEVTTVGEVALVLQLAYLHLTAVLVGYALLLMAVRWLRPGGPRAGLGREAIAGSTALLGVFLVCLLVDAGWAGLASPLLTAGVLVCLACRAAPPRLANGSRAAGGALSIGAMAMFLCIGLGLLESADWRFAVAPVAALTYIAVLTRMTGANIRHILGPTLVLGLPLAAFVVWRA
ncbi:MAG: hypothetical protein R3F61_19015 [Myxococcota bacterium]